VAYHLSIDYHHLLFVWEPTNGVAIGITNIGFDIGFSGFDELLYYAQFNQALKKMD